MTEKKDFIEAEMAEIKRRPYEYITKYYENLYPHMGGKVMSILCLLPCSLIVPPLTDGNGKKIMARISYLLLSPPGSAKSSISEHFKKFTYNPFAFESITDAKLDSVLVFKRRVTLITSDIARIFKDKDLVKQLENILGDEGKLSRLTKSTGDEEQLVEGIAYLSGTPENLTGTLRDGMVFRVYPQLIYHSDEEHSDILDKVNRGIGKGVKKDTFNKEDVIIEFYNRLLANQDMSKKAELPKIEGYVIDETFRTRVTDELIPLFEKPFKETNFEFIRELIRFYRLLVAYSFLNIYNRKIVQEDGIHKLVVEEEDFRVALELSKQEIKSKTTILHALNKVSERRFRNNNDLKMYALKEKKEGRPLSREEYESMKVLINYR